ncbi:hypothetical protein [Prevotella sp. HUN102]|uniref:hypothetical protein n=1 Tax=Prevotella sp. HUN102 TaxID=1392486 RepID=UPI0012DE855E|nr:hypothetical protein [Prevotella sp. HUN102]
MKKPAIITHHSSLITHSCYQCNNAYLMRSAPHNPVISECTITHEREVASKMIRCRHFKQRMGEAEINPMTPYKLK